MMINCVWEHNGDDTLLYAVDFPGAFTRGESLEAATEKMPREIKAYTAWLHADTPPVDGVSVVQDVPCKLNVRDADSDVLFLSEEPPLSHEEYDRLKVMALRSATDLQALYDSIPSKDTCASSERKTFYGQVPRTAREMYEHTKNVNNYYFGEIDVPAHNEGSILECRIRGFEQLEKANGYLSNPVIDGSYGEKWTLRKMLRRFIWHDRIHAKAMYRMAVKLWGREAIPDVFYFGDLV